MRHSAKDLLQELAPHVSLSCCGNKIYLGELSPGCRTCGEGSWACLFLTNRCSANCFFCPRDPSENYEPKVENITFSAPEEYSDFIRLLGYRGVGISGGDPLLRMELLLDYLRAIRANHSRDIYTWLYTSGINITEGAIRALRDAGLDEVRLNIAAMDYEPTKIRIASKYIDNVTVEIPAIPNDYEKLITILPELCRSGIRYLNLHELHVPDNKIAEFKEMGYNTLTKYDLCVEDSEICAFNIMLESINKNLPLSINYCSRLYKYRVQSALRRKRIASFTALPHEEVAESGYIRRIWCEGNRGVLKGLMSHLNATGIADDLWRYEGSKGRLYMHPSVVRNIISSVDGIHFAIDYHRAFLSCEPDTKRESTTLKLNSEKDIYILRDHVTTFKRLGTKEMVVIDDLLIGKGRGKGCMDRCDLDRIDKQSFLEPLIEYEIVVPAFR